MLNSVTLVGKAVETPAVRYYESGSVEARVTMSIHRSDDELLVEIEAWGKNAQIIADYVRPGTLFGIIGALRKGDRTRIIVDRVEIL